MKKAHMVLLSLCFALLTSGCVRTSWEAYRLQRAEIEEKCRVQMGWDDPMCKYLDENTVESIGAGNAFP